MKRALLRFYRNIRGATAIEYGLLVAGIGVFILGTVFTVGTDLEGLFAAIGNTLANSVAQAGGG